jgi:hypothetical protein
MIKNAIKKYNTLAAKASPPCKQLNPKDVLELTRLSDFKLLQESRSEVLVQTWVQPHIREATNHSLRVLRAREELVRVQVEAKRFQTWMRDDVDHIKQTILVLEEADPPLAYVLRHRLDYQLQTNLVNLSFVRRIEKHIFFNGTAGPGSRSDTDRTGFTPQLASPLAENAEPHLPGDLDDDDDDDDQLADIVEGYSRIAHAPCE